MIRKNRYKIYNFYPDPVIIISKELKIIWCNQACHKINIFKIKTIINHYVSDIFSDKDFLILNENIENTLKDKTSLICYLNDLICYVKITPIKKSVLLEILNDNEIKKLIEISNNNEIISKDRQGKIFTGDVEINNFLSEYLEKFIKCRNINKLMHIICNASMSILNPDNINIYLEDVKSIIKLKFSSQKTANTKSIQNQILFIIDELKKYKSFFWVTSDTNKSKNRSLYKYLHERNAGSIFFIPMKNSGKLVGVIELLFNDIATLNKDKINLLEGIANIAVITLEKINYINEEKDIQNAIDRHSKLIAIGRIVAGVAHELNNPLSIMQLDLDELKMIDIAVNDEQAEIYSSLQEEIERMTDIIRQLKDYARPENELTEKVELINIGDLFRSYPVKIYLKNLQKKKVTVNLNILDKDTTINISRNRFIQVIMNLLSNADEAILNKKQGKIDISIYRKEKNVYIDIEDNGTGIKQKDLLNIFEPFFTTKIGEGSGLGLSISYSIVKKYNGDIKVKSSEGKGAFFSIIFPFAVIY